MCFSSVFKTRSEKRRFLSTQNLIYFWQLKHLHDCFPYVLTRNSMFFLLENTLLRYSVDIWLEKFSTFLDKKVEKSCQTFQRKWNEMKRLKGNFQGSFETFGNPILWINEWKYFTNVIKLSKICAECVKVECLNDMKTCLTETWTWSWRAATSENTWKSCLSLITLPTVIKWICFCVLFSVWISILNLFFSRKGRATETRSKRKKQKPAGIDFLSMTNDFCKLLRIWNFFSPDWKFWSLLINCST